jgi:HAD superfamily hydrolase (TIGR01549 family)
MESRDVRYVPIRDLISDCLGRYLREHGIIMSHEDESWVKELYVGAHERYSRLSEGALDGIEKMKELSDHLGVISDADDDYLKRVLKALGIMDMLDSITSSEEAGVGKPNPKIFEMATEKSGKADVFYYIGDSERRDIKGAIGVGMVPILISKDKETESDAEFIAENLYEAALWIEENIKRYGEMGRC